MKYECFICGRRLSKMNHHPVFCKAHKKHVMCGTCIPDLSRAGILVWTTEKMMHTPTGEYEGTCPNKELAAAARLMGHL